jgi:hypothetical protein
MKKRDKEKRKRMSLQNQDIMRNNLNLVVENSKKEEEKEVTEEEDPLKFFSQQERKKKKEEEAKKYLLPITEEEDPLKFFDQQNKTEEAQDPLKFLKNEQVGQGENILNLEKHDEEKLAEAIKNNELPEEVVVKKKEREDKEPHEEKAKAQKLVKRMKTAQRLSLKGFYKERDIDEVLKRVQNSKNTGNAQDAIDNMKEKAAGGNTLLGSEEQVDPAKNPQATTTKQVDLKNFMQKK